MKWGRNGNEWNKMDAYHDRYDDGETVVTLKFRKRADMSKDDIIDQIDYALRPIECFTKDLEIGIN